ncbi:MAG: transketolase [Dehalococcoidales bacterium]|jgi:transketolase
MTTPGIDELSVNTLRFLAVDTVEKARSGHPGMPMGAAAIAYVLWDRFLKHNPANPKWPDRDRFILSAGHASALLYALLHLSGYDLTLEELKQFRQWQSRTPGHIEYGITPGVEVTTGPLGQGFACGVGMAMAERWLASRYNTPDNEIIDHHTYTLVSDGDMEEGISAEAASLAGTLCLGKLICLYDKNNISIEGNTDIAFTEDVGQRFRSYHWHVIGPIDGFDVSALEKAIKEAKAEKSRPSLIICRTTIGYGSPNKQGTASAHGEPLGEAEVRLSKENLSWSYRDAFSIPQEVLDHFRKARARGQQAQQEWQAKLADYRRQQPELARDFERELSGELPAGWDSELERVFARDEKPMATREASGRVMNAIARKVPTLIGGSADLSPSNKTTLADTGDFSASDYRGRNLHFGVREHAMGCVANGLALHGGAIPYTATFLVFYDYMRPPVRLAAMMGIRVIYIFTHDSIGLGEDGPTHQPIEQIMGLRLVPNLVTLRPADATETVEAWRVALERRDGPTTLVLSRQKLPLLDRMTLAPASGLRQGGYTLWEASPEPQVILIATGSEVSIALEAGKLLKEESNVSSRVVSLPSWELFDAQPKEYRGKVLPSNITARVAMETGTTHGWERYVGNSGVTIGLNHFGMSAPGEVLYERFGFTSRHMADEALSQL